MPAIDVVRIAVVRIAVVRELLLWMTRISISLQLGALNLNDDNLTVVYESIPASDTVDSVHTKLSATLRHFSR